MRVWVALLRGVNVGGHRKVPMADLRSLCGELGWRSVRTYIASGNVVLGSPQSSAVALGEELSGALGARFGFPVEVMVRSRDELGRVVDDVPSADVDRLHVAFLGRESAIEEALAWQSALTNGASLVLVGSHGYLRAPRGLADPVMTGRAAKDFAAAATVRNWRTVLALRRLADEVADELGERPPSP